VPDPADLPHERASLESILAAAWTRLGRGAADPAQDWHWPVLASVDARDAAGPAPDARIVVLRRADPSARELEIHADARTHKLAQLHAAPRACLVFHDRAAGLQLRAWADAAAHAGDAVARRAWDALAATSRRTYRAPRTPGEPTGAPDPNLPDDDATPPDRSGPHADGIPSDGFERFAAIVLRVRRLEWLHLDRAGHRRARFDWEADATTPVATWIRP
jgi:hypothetical protein